MMRDLATLMPDEPLTAAESADFDRVAVRALANNQQPRGVRFLGPQDVALLERIAALSRTVETLVFDIDTHLKVQKTAAQFDGAVAVMQAQRMRRAQPDKWLVLAVDDLQDGLMKLKRSVEQPSDF